jgi:biofilm PGA synthesis N-glycosyltransferase PgaC
MTSSNQASDTRYVIITPARDEEKHLEETIRSVIAQTVRPAEWVIVDDGSTDGTAAILRRFAAEHAWISVIHLADRGRRDADTGAVGAFLIGYRTLRAEAWEYLVNLDADLGLGPDYFEKCFAEFRRDPQLGIGGGTLYHFNGAGQPVTEPCPRSHVRGATKIFRRACWEAFGGLAEVPGWDTLDEIKANMAGWRTGSFPHIRALHKRPTGAADGSWRDAVKNGRCDYFLGYHPLFMLLKCGKRLFRRRFVTDGLGHLWGYLHGYLRGRPQLADPAAIAFLRKQQLRRLLFLETFPR